MKIRRFEEIQGWQLARELTCKVYSLSRQRETFARDFGLRDQIRAAAGSAMHNIAEGFDAGSNAEFIRFLRYAQRSCTEVQSELYVALDENYVTNTEFKDVYDHADRTRAAIHGFIHYLEQCGKQKPNPSTPPHPEPRTLNLEPKPSLMSHFIRIMTQIREREQLLNALRDLHYQHQASPNQTNDLVVRGYQGNRERAEVLVETNSAYDIGFQRKDQGYEVVADWWGVERNSPIKQAAFIQQINRQYAYNVIRDQIREQNLITEEERTLENGDLIITLSERG